MVLNYEFSKLMVGLEWCVVILWIVWCVVSSFWCEVFYFKKKKKNNQFLNIVRGTRSRGEQKTLSR